MILLQTLKWDNCFSYGEGNILQLDQDSVTQIIGVNGSGKSSIPVILEEVLYNKNSKGIKKADIPNRYANKGYDISLSFTKDDDQYEIMVCRRSSLKVKLTKNGEDISSHTATATYKTLQEILGVDFKTFSQLVYQSMTSSLQFLTATDTTRKKFLIDLLDLEVYVKLSDLMKKSKTEADKVLAEVKSKTDTIQSWLNKNNLIDTTPLPITETRYIPSFDGEYISSLQGKLENLSKINRKIQENNMNKDQLASIDLSKYDVKGSIESYDHEQSELGAKKAELKQATALVSKLKDLGDVCHACEQPVDPNFKIKMLEAEESKAATLRKECEELFSKIKEVKEHNTKVEARQLAERKWENLYKSIDNSLPSELEDEGDLKQRIAEAKEDLRQTKELNKKIEEENLKAEKHNARIAVVLEQTAKFKEELEKAGKDLEEQEELSKTLEVLKKSFSTNGLIAYKIENLVKELEDLVNIYLGELSDGRFTLSFVVSNDKLNVVITDNGKTIDIMSLSSGELARVNTATLLAIRKLMNSISKSRINILFLDEVINTLDTNGKERLVEVLTQENNLNTYIVSHNWEHPLLAKLSVVKEDNYSSVA